MQKQPQMTVASQFSGHHLHLKGGRGSYVKVFSNVFYTFAYPANPDHFTMKNFYLVTTDHLEEALWFRDDEDFAVGMNYVAIEAHMNPMVIVMVFILMSNHVHFILYGEKEDVEAFITQYKQRYSLYYRYKYCVKEFLRGNGVDIKLIPIEEAEAFERFAAYVQMNSVAANICSHPSQYRWGTGNLFFNLFAQRGTPLREFSGRELARILHSTTIDLPGNWLMSEDGFILPQSYIDISTVERYFRTPNRMNYFLQHSSKARKRLESSESNLPAFRDQTLLNNVTDLCRSLFQKDSFKQLSPDEQSELAKQIRYRFSADATQIARVCGISYSAAADLLDRL